MASLGTSTSAAGDEGACHPLLQHWQPYLLAMVRSEHATMTELSKDNDRMRLVAVVKEHLQPAKKAYLQLGRHLNRLR